jgi:septal ring factor EnvC (AmiA/AmiB activator)
MSSADILATITTVQGEKEKYEQLKTKLSGKSTPEKFLLTRNTQGMAGTKYKNQHEEIKELFSTFKSSVSKEKENALEELEIKISSLGRKIVDLEEQYQTALANERAAAERKAAEARRKREQARNKKR